MNSWGICFRKIFIALLSSLLAFQPPASRARFASNATIYDAKVAAGEAVNIEGDSVSIIGAQEKDAFSSTSKKSGLFASSGGGFFSLWGKESKAKDATETQNVGAELSAGTDVNIKARESDVKLDDTRQEVRATVGEGEITIRDKDKQAELEAEGKTEDLAALNRDPDKAYEITKDKHVDVEFYVSDTSLKAAANAVEVAGKTIGQALEAISAKLAASGDLTPQELETAKKVSKALDDGTLDLKQLITCSGRQGFNLMDWIVGTAHASTGCALFDNAGKKITDLTPQEREACIQMLASLMEKYANEYLTGGKGSGELPGSVHTIAEALRSIGSDEQLVAGAQALGMSASFIRDMSIRLALGEEGYRDFQREIEPLAAVGQLGKEAAERAIEKIAADHGLSLQDTKDLKLVAGVTTAAVISALGKISPNKLHHIFGQQKHKLDPLLAKFGGDQKKTYAAIDAAAQKALLEGKLNLKGGINTQTRILVDGMEVDLVGGRVVNGRFEIGSASRRDIP